MVFNKDREENTNFIFNFVSDFFDTKDIVVSYNMRKIEFSIKEPKKFPNKINIPHNIIPQLYFLFKLKEKKNGYLFFSSDSEPIFKLTGKEVKYFREKIGLSLSDTAQVLGYANRFNISRIESYDFAPDTYYKSLVLLKDSMLFYTLKIDNMKLETPTFKIAKKRSFVRRIYSNNFDKVKKLAQELNRNVITRKDKLYKYEIIVF